MQRFKFTKIIFFEFVWVKRFSIFTIKTLRQSVALVDINRQDRQNQSSADGEYPDLFALTLLKEAGVGLTQIKEGDLN